MTSQQIVTWKRNGLRLRVLTPTIVGRYGEECIQVQKETAQDHHGIFSLRLDEVEQ